MASSCSISTHGKYKIGAKFIVSSQAVYDSSTGTTTYGWYSSELGGWIKGTDTDLGLEPSALGSSSTVKANGEVYGTSECTGTAIDTVSSTTATLYAVSINTSGYGTVAKSSGTLYGDRYALSGSTIGFTVTPSSGSQIKSVKSNGTVISSPYSVIVASDTQIVASFVLSSYTLSPQSITGGTMTAKKDGEAVSTASVGDTIVFACTANSGYHFNYMTLNGVRYSNQTKSVVIAGSPNDGTFEYGSSFSANSTVVDNVTATTGGSVSITTSDGASVTVDSNGNFSTFVSAGYKIIATPNSGYVIEGIYESGKKLADTSPYSFTQYDSPKTFRVVFEQGATSSVELYCGGDASSTDSTWNGCSCTKSNTGTSYTFVPSAATGYTFKYLYIKDNDGTGKGKVINSGSSYTTTIDFNATVVAVFKKDSDPTYPSDEDQGNASSASSTVCEWEGSANGDAMSAVWASRRYVFMRPIPLSCARVYADGYGSFGPKLSVKQYESPSATDISPGSVSLVAASQDAFRLPVRRPEKYVEIEVETNKKVLEVTVGTSMGALCQKNT